MGGGVPGSGPAGGLYHSLLDWHHPEFPIDGLHPQRDDEQAVAAAKDRDVARYAEYLHGQVRELLTGYGPGVPDSYIQNGKLNLTNPDFIKGIQAQAELSYKYHVTPPYSTAPGWSSQEFTSGKVGMEVNGPWDLINLKSQANFPVGWVEFPAGPNGVHTYNEGSGFGITRDCKDPDAAFKALTVLVGSKALSYAGSQGRAFPARLAADPSWSQFAGGNAGAVMGTALKQARPQQVTTNWTQFQTALGKYTAQVLSGQISAAQFASQVQAASGQGTGVAPGNLSRSSRTGSALR